MTLKPKGGFRHELRNELSGKLAIWRLSLSSWQTLQKQRIDFAKRGGAFFLNEPRTN